MWAVSIAVLIGIVSAAFIWYSFGLAQNVLAMVSRRRQENESIPQDESTD